MSKHECKNCVHCDVCRIREFPSIQEILEDGCNKYKDKSLVVELPCKVGDEVYYLTSIDTAKELNVKEIFCGIVQAVCYERKDIYLTAKYTNGLTYYHNLKDLGKTVFLTKEEAEAKLKESWESK